MRQDIAMALIALVLIAIFIALVVNFFVNYDPTVSGGVPGLLTQTGL